MFWVKGYHEAVVKRNLERPTHTTDALLPLLPNPSDPPKLLEQSTPSGLEGCQDKRNGRKLLEEKGTGSPTHPPTDVNLQLTVAVINPYWLPPLDNPAYP